MIHMKQGAPPPPIPADVEAKPWYSMEAKADEKRATLHIYEAIGGWWGVDAAQLVRELHALGDLDAIDVYINSPGGDAFDGVAIYNALRRNKATVNVTVDGLAASAASLIAMAGDTVTMARGSELMIHDASAVAWGNAELMSETAALLDKLSDSYADCYAARAGGTSKAWREVMKAETWYTAAEAVAAGLADKTDDEKDGTEAKARFDLSVFAHAGRADAPAPKLPVAAATHVPPVSPEPGHPHQKETDTMSDTNLTAGLRERLGITDAETSEDAILAALDEVLAEQADTPEPQAAKLPDGVTMIETDVLAALQASAAKVDKIEAERAAERRVGLVEAAIKDGKIAPARRDHWLAQLNADEEGATAFLATLAAGTIPLQEVGHSDEAASADEALYAKVEGATTTQKEA